MKVISIRMTKLSHNNQELGFPGGTSGKEPICQYRRQEVWVRSLGGEEPLEEGVAIHSIRFGHNWSDSAHGHTTENHQWLNSKVYFMLPLRCRSAVKGYSCSHSGTCAERIHSDTCSEREGQRTKGLLLWLWKFMHRSDTHHFCSHLIGQNKSCDHLRVLVSPLRVWMFVNGYHILIDFNFYQFSEYETVTCYFYLYVLNCYWGWAYIQMFFVHMCLLFWKLPVFIPWPLFYWVFQIWFCSISL